MARDEFSADVKDVLARRGAMRCSWPGCDQLTAGPREDPAKVVNVGVAAHISAAAPGGPRYDPRMTAEERRSPENGIWLCQTHAKLIDNDEARYTAPLLREWKRQHEERVRAEVEGRSGRQVAHQRLTEEEHDLLLRARARGEILLLRSEQEGGWVAVGSRDYTDPNDCSAAARYRDALDSLSQRGLVRHEGGELHVLTAEGFRVAGRLQPRLKIELPSAINVPGHFSPPYTPAWNVRVRLTTHRTPVDVVEVSLHEEGVGDWLIEELFRDGQRITLPIRVHGAAEFWVRARSPRTYDGGPVQLGALTLRIRDHLQVPGDAHEFAYGTCVTQ